MAAVGDEETFVDTHEKVEIDDEDLDGEVEDVEACFALIPGRVVPWSFPACEVDSDPEDCTCAEESRSQEQNRNLVPEPPATEFLHTGLARYDESRDDE